MYTRRNGEDIICAHFGPSARREAHVRAVKLSMGKRHGWAKVWYLRGTRLMARTYYDGKLYSLGEWPVDPWYSSTETIRHAIARLRRDIRSRV